MSRVLVVGSGASGVHFALTLLGKGIDVTMIDVGFQGTEPIYPEANLNRLKESLEDPVSYFLGEQLEGIVMPDGKAEYYGIPPGKNHVLHRPGWFGVSSEGFSPLFSFAQGGLAEVWTGGCYPLNDADLGDFPFGFAEIEPYYSEVARRIGISGTNDDLTQFLPWHEHIQPALELDHHSQRLLSDYEGKRSRVNGKLGCFMGRTRVATLSRTQNERGSCDYLGRCLWGCPVGALYTPSMTLRECMRHPNFTYLPGLRVRFFRTGANQRVKSVVAREVGGTGETEIPVDRLVLAAGTLCSTEIFLRSILEMGGERLRLGGLMDNRQILVPFVNLHLVGQTYDPDSYQYHLLGMGLTGDRPQDYVHGQITTLKTGMVHPIIQNLPFDIATSTFVTRSMRAALGIVNVNFPDTRREGNYVTLEESGDGGEDRLTVRYSAPAGEDTDLARALRRVKRALLELGCVVPPGMVHIRPMGASVHYAGTLPMSSQTGPWSTTEYGQSREFENLFMGDGATFPFLPAKNLTFSLMANAVRIAEEAF